MLRITKHIGLGLVICGLLLPIISVAAEKEKGAATPGVLPPQSNPFGKTYGEWQAEWWKWVYSLPLASHPLRDDTGGLAAMGQSGHVWFLGGVVNNAGPATSVSRTCTIPSGKALFFPIANAAWVTYPSDANEAWQPGDPYLEQNMAWFAQNENEGYAGMGIRPLLAMIMQFARNLSCEVDGVPVADLETYHSQSPAYMASMPEGNVNGLPAGVHGPCCDDGYYVMLAPLSVGQHTIHFYAEFDLPWGETSYQDITYNLTVVPMGKYQ